MIFIADSDYFDLEAAMRRVVSDCLNLVRKVQRTEVWSDGVLQHSPTAHSRLASCSNLAQNYFSPVKTLAEWLTSTEGHHISCNFGATETTSAGCTAGSRN